MIGEVMTYQDREVRHRDAWLLLVLADPRVTSTGKWVMAVTVLLQPDPLVVTISEEKLLEKGEPLFRRLKRVALAWLEERDSDESESVAIAAALRRCGWQPDLPGALAELRRLGRSDLADLLQEH